MILRDFHVHSTYCDGKSTLEETVLAAIEKGIRHLGFSGHSYTPFDEGYCMSPSDTKRYVAEIKTLKEKYKDKIKIYCGIEKDVFSDIDTSEFDYAIGSAHYILADGCYIPVDLNAQTLLKGANEHFGGDIYSLAEAYYETVSLLADKEFDIIGHFDLITKFNRNGAMFDESNPRYVKAVYSALEKLVPLGKTFEINTGVIVRGYKDTPYPADFIIKAINEMGGSFILNSDSHRSDMLCFEFEKWFSHASALNVKWYK